MEQYTQMKSSGVPWILDIPESWGIRVLFQLADQVKNKNRDLSEHNLLSLSYGRIKRKDINSSDGLLPESFDGYNIIEANDIVLRLTDLQNDHTSLRVGQSHERGIITSAYTTLRPSSLVRPEYLYYVLHAYDLIKGFYGMGSGVRQGLNYDEVKTIKIPFPPQVEQQVIAAYLDDQIAQIDSIIDEAQTSIEEYKQWEAAVIFEAVTKGIIPNRDMKESGLQFIGLIPETWRCVKIARVLERSKDGIRVGPFGSSLTNAVVSAAEGKIKIYGQANLIRKDFAYGDKYVTEETYQRLKEYEVRPGDVAVSMMGTIGKCCVVPSGIDLGIMDSHLIKVRLNDMILPKYFEYVYESYAVFEQLKNLSKGSIMSGLNSSIVKSAYITLPDISEQASIVTFLDRQCGIIDSLIAEKQSLIEDVETYKRSLIYEAVTGKRKVV